MHDFLLAKEIISQLKEIIQEKKLSKIRSVSLEIGQIMLAHDDFEEHIEDISIENLLFGLESSAKGTVLEKAKFLIKKTTTNSWKITNIEVE